MQGSQAGAKGCHRVGVDEQLIIFRPSANFQKMKKFLRSRGDYPENNNQSPTHGSDQSPSTSASPEPLTTKEEQRELLEKAKSVQPPLPPVPPPVIPINFSLPQKQEIETNEYEDQDSIEESVQEEASQFESKSQNETNTVIKPRPTMCRDFVRGTCSRGAACRYAHVRDLAQLPGVYTFCRNYQNSSCTFPHCRYVHASIFEEQRYYRTGVLPPHALSHHKKPNVLPPPPPPPLPPPPPPPEEHPVEIPIFANAPPPVAPSANKPVISCVPTANLETRPVEFDFRINQQRDIGPKSPIKCKNCDTMEFRLQFNKDKIENLKRTTDELKSKVAILTNKTHSFYTAIIGIMRPPNQKKPEGLMGLSAFLNMIGENEKKQLAANINGNLSNMLLKDTAEQNNEGRDS